jgi:nicotinamidase-related amidase
MKSNMLKRENAALLVIDLQEKLLPKIFEHERVTKNCILLIRLAQILDIPLMVTTQYEKGLGPTVEEISSVLGETSPVDKVEFGCFNNAGFTERIKSLGPSRSNLILCGIESHICVTQTALGALGNGYIVSVASDAVSSRTSWNWRIGLDRMKEAGAIISSTEMIMYELLERSDSSEFKAILPYLRDPSS